MRFTVIIPDRGDRPQFLKHCLWQMERQTVQPAEILLVNHHPRHPGPDLVERLQKGIDRARHNRIFFIENDDYYPDNYFEVMLRFNRFDFIGIRQTVYYHIFKHRYSILNHGFQQRSSLFCTAINKDRLDLKVLEGNNFVDLRIWEHAVKGLFALTDLDIICPIGIKHGIGLCGGGGHRDNMLMDDTDLSWLRNHTRKESFEFYGALCTTGIYQGGEMPLS